MATHGPPPDCLLLVSSAGLAGRLLAYPQPTAAFLACPSPQRISVAPLNENGSIGMGKSYHICGAGRCVDAPSAIGGGDPIQTSRHCSSVVPSNSRNPSRPAIIMSGGTSRETKTSSIHRSRVRSSLLGRLV